MRKFVSRLVIVAATIALASCGGGSGGSLTGESGTGSTGTGTGTGTGTSTTPTYSMGNGSGSSFESGMIGISSTSVSAGGSTSLTVSIVDQTGTLYTAEPVTVTFSSTCISQGLAAVTASGSSAAGSTANTVETTTGTVDATYTAKGCSGSDVITASATVASSSLTATGTVSVASAATGSLQFVSATPTTIGLKGTGQPSTSTVIFKVLDSTGAPKAGVTVNFSLNTTVGGLSFSPASASSAADGTVQTVVSSGTVHTPVTVTATIASPELSTQSSSLTVSTGIPASNTFTVAVGPATYASGTSTLACPNVEAWDLEGVTVPITVSLADRYDNPVLDGTAVSLYTDGGKITGSCTTADGTGTCTGTGGTITWTSENPQPTPDTALPSKSSEPGRVVLLATAIGEESFDDANGSGFYQSGDEFTNLGDPYDNSQELSSPQAPYTNSAYVLGDYFLDYKQTGQYAPPPTPPVFVGITCNGTTASSTCTESTLAISQSALIIMSTGPATVSLAGAGGVFSISNGNVVNTAAGSGTITFNISSYYGDYSTGVSANPIPAGSLVSFSVGGTIGTVDTSTTSFTEGCSTSSTGDQFTVLLDNVPASASGTLNVKVTSAGTSSLTLYSLPVN
jgi:hypothetical protein